MIPQVQPKASIMQYIRMGVFILVHFSILAVIWTGVTGASVAICIALYVIHMWSVTAGYHRYFSHKSFSTSRVFQFILAWLAQSTTQKGVLWWANHHRLHHLNSDTESDTHSPRQKGFFYSHVGWIFDPNNIAEQKYTMVKDFERFPELVWLDKHDLLPTMLLGVIVFLLAGWSGLVVGFLFSRVLVWNATYTINSLSHVYGSQRYNTGDDSRNNFWLALLTFGEGWHNNHHYYASSARQGFFWWEIDITYYILKMLSWFGIVWDIKVPSEEILHGTKNLSPGAKVRSKELIKSVSIDLPKLAVNLSELILEMKKLYASAEASKKLHIQSLAANIKLFVISNSQSLKKLPPKLRALMRDYLLNAERALQLTLDAMRVASKEKVGAAILALEQAAGKVAVLV